MNAVHIIGFTTTAGAFQPLAWSKGKLSKKLLKKAVSKFYNDEDFEEPAQYHWERLYQRPMDAKKELPEWV